MTIVTVQFDQDGRDEFKRLMDVFRSSIERNMPEAKLVELTVPKVPDKEHGKSYKMTSNTEKLDVWCDFMETCEDNVIFADCDMLMLRDASHAFDVPFDVAYTRRTVVTNIPVNAGIIMARPTEKARGFFRKWRDVNRAMYEENGKWCKEWQAKYPGMNQAALGYMLDTGDYDADLHVYLTRQWNAVECDWMHIDSDTVFVHIKSALRCVLQHKKPYKPIYRPMELWYEEAGIDMPKYDPFKGMAPSMKRARLRALMAKKKEMLNGCDDVAEADAV